MIFCIVNFLFYIFCAYFFYANIVSNLLESSLINCVDDFKNVYKYNWCKALYEYMAPQIEVINVILSLWQKLDDLEGNQNLMVKDLHNSWLYVIIFYYSCIDLCHSKF